MSYDYSINLFNAATQGAQQIGAITDIISGYQDSSRANGGFWTGQFNLNNKPIHMLEEWFNTYLGFRVQRIVNGLVMWDGLISQMRLTSHGQTWERDLNKMVNRARVDYISTNGSTRSETAWNTIANSITQFGQRDEIYTFDGADATLAAALRDTRLSEFGWPRSRGAGGEMYNPALAKQAPALQVLMIGYVFTMNWRYVVSNILLPLQNLSDYMTTIVGECEFVSVGSIAANTTQVMGGFPTEMRVWDGINKMVECGDSSGNRYIAQVRKDRKFYYELAETDITYLAMDGKVLGRSGESLLAGEVKPNNIIQRTDSIPVTSLSTGIYDPRNCYIEQVDFIGGSTATPSTCRIMTEDWTLADQLQALLAYKQEIGRIEERQRGYDRNRED